MFMICMWRFWSSEIVVLKASRVIEADFKSLLNEHHLSVETQVLMALPKLVVDRARVF